MALHTRKRPVAKIFVGKADRDSRATPPRGVRIEHSLLCLGRCAACGLLGTDISDSGPGFGNSGVGGSWCGVCDVCVCKPARPQSAHCERTETGPRVKSRLCLARILKYYSCSRTSEGRPKGWPSDVELCRNRGNKAVTTADRGHLQMKARVLGMSTLIHK